MFYCLLQDEVADDAQSDVDFGNQFSDLGNNSMINKSVMSSLPADMSRLPTADSDGRLNTGLHSSSLCSIDSIGALTLFTYMS